MNKGKFWLVLLVLFMPMVVNVASAASDFRQHLDRLEFGVSAGVGFYVGQSNPVAGSDITRVQSYDALGFGEKATLKWPGIETFGFQVGYRFDTHWHVKLQTTRQRLCFAEYQNNDPKSRCVYYNAMWHLDAMAEYNILALGNVMAPKQGLYNVVPYVGFGLGITMFNKEATLRSNYTGTDVNTYYPSVGSKQVNGNWEPGEVAVGLYIPVAFGVKWRINDNVQLKGTFQYQLYFSNATPGGLNSNLEGGSYVYGYANADQRPKFDELNKQVVGANHDCLFSISAIFNLGKWFEDRLITY
jgi:hypothetical protein